MDHNVIIVKHKISTPVLTILVLICTFLIFSANAGGRPQAGYELYWQALGGAIVASWMFGFALFWGKKYALASLGFLLMLNFCAAVRDISGLGYWFFLAPVIALILGYLLLRPTKNVKLVGLRRFLVWCLSFGAFAVGAHTLICMWCLSYGFGLEMPFLLVALFMAIFTLLAFARFSGTIKAIDRRILIVYAVAGAMLIRQLMFIEIVA